MDRCARVKGFPLFDVLPDGARARGGCHISRRSSFGKIGLPRPTVDFQEVSCCHVKYSPDRLRSLVALASAEFNESNYKSVGIPLELCTPEGKFLCGILKDQPHIFRAAAAKQLEELVFERDSAFARWELSEGSSESCLHGIAEIKERECQIVVEEIMYMLIVHSFSVINVPMVPNLWKCISNGRVEIWSSKEKELESMHEIELLEMVREHLSNILRLQGKSDSTGNWTTIKIEQLQLGRLYAASIMYGYFLKSVSLRHALDISFSSSSEDILSDQIIQASFPRFAKQEQQNLVTLGCSLDKISSSYSIARRGNADQLRGYMMGFDSKALRLCAKLRSREAANLIENHSWALFGNPESGSLDKGEVVSVMFSGLKRLILEAVAFGCFLWDVEWYVDSKYRLNEN
ncbi:hypothetical protein AXF42_Ash004181 [Apostasia shenzhenica]|uniref:UV-B-induced protein n=1 Tax=Apostasia shenzhenica TaxID=1088818 RepID=A0A2I0A268_9ASPA|nr:hypothetical protein AXF42_Ash004181 [Apostasia shenzhenica]